jgi:hypothetical protein
VFFATDALTLRKGSEENDGRQFLLKELENRNQEKTMENLMFQGKSVQYWRNEIERRRAGSFNDVVAFFEREHGLSKARAKIAARKVAPEKYNEFMAKAHRQTL